MPKTTEGATTTSDAPKPGDTAVAETPKPAETPAVTPKVETPGVPKVEEQPKPAETPKAEEPKVPEKYELKLPEGGSTYVDDADLKEITDLAKREGWSNEDAQAYVEETVARSKFVTEKFLTETKAHPEIGGENLEAAQQHANRFIDHFVPANTPEGEALRRGLLKTGGTGWMPLILLFSRAGKAMAEDMPAFGGGGAAPARSAEEILYGATTKK